MPQAFGASSVLEQCPRCLESPQVEYTISTSRNASWLFDRMSLPSRPWTFPSRSGLQDQLGDTAFQGSRSHNWKRYPKGAGPLAFLKRRATPEPPVAEFLMLTARKFDEDNRSIGILASLNAEGNPRRPDFSRRSELLTLRRAAPYHTDRSVERPRFSVPCILQADLTRTFRAKAAMTSGFLVCKPDSPDRLAGRQD